MMNLNDIKGIIEINGESYDPKTILKALIEQGLKIHPLNGSLLVGRTFVDASPNLQYGSSSCPISEHCKIYDKLYQQQTSKAFSSENNLKQTTQPSIYDGDSNQSSSNRFYTDPIKIDLDDLDITNLFSDPLTDSLSSDDLEEDVFLDPDFNRELDSDPTEMVGLSPLTRYGGDMSRIPETNIPAEYRSRCPYCNSVVNIRWKYCGSCGTSLE